MVLMKIVSAAEMQACDRITSERFGIPSWQLMRSAATAVTGFVLQQFPSAQRIAILCGRGNNGGDGMVTARLLAEAGRAVKVLLLGDPAGLHGDASRAWADITERSVLPGTVSTAVVLKDSELDSLTEALKADLILDAVLGTGFKPPLRDLPLAALQWLQANRGDVPTVSIDLPSGWNADSTEMTQQDVYPSDAVVTFTAPKPAHVFGQLTRSIRQPVVVAPIGSPDEAIVSTLNLHWSGVSKSIAEPERPADSNKGMYGHVLVIGGSPGKSGAPAMGSLAALRTGAGLVTAAVTPSVLPLVAAITPELMTQALAVTPTGEISEQNLATDNLKALLKGITVLAVGPGLGTNPETADFALGLLTQSRLPVVVDADALNILSKHIDRLPGIAAGRTMVLTPHPGEMGRLTGLGTKAVQADRIAIARDFATRNQVILVLKGWRTLIAHPDGTIAVNTTGNPGMAKGGSGDLLTGMVAAMLAQFPDRAGQAVEAAVYLHGLAADLAVRSDTPGGNQHTLLATDLLSFLHRAFRFHPQTPKGYCWLQGLPANE
jgi:NAD(P)H-hydrate epimerase